MSTQKHTQTVEMNPIDSITAELDRLSEVEAKGLKAKWRFAHQYDDGAGVPRGTVVTDIGYAVAFQVTQLDGEAIATARNSMRPLIEALRKATEALRIIEHADDLTITGESALAETERRLNRCTSGAENTLAAIAETLKEGK